MRKYLYIISVLSLTIISIAASAQSMSKSFTFGGQSRTYRVYLPTGFNANTSLPLVLSLHGLGSNASQQEAYSQFNNVADTGRCVVAYPDGIGGNWNMVVGCPVSGTQPCYNSDDVGFISALIDTMKKNYNIDLGRVYACGMSMGAYMSNRLGCELSCKITAIGPVTGLLQEATGLYPTCNPSRKMPVMQFHGTADSTVKYTNTLPQASVASTMARWKSINSCTGAPTVTQMPDINGSDGSTATKNDYNPCGQSVQLIQYTINGGAHTWPGSPFGGAGTNLDISATSLLWNFFKQFSTPGSLTFTGLASSYCTGASPVTLTGVPAGGTFSGTGVSGSTFSPASAGTPTVTYSITANGCTYTNKQVVTVAGCTGIDGLTVEDFSIFPNPVANTLSINYNLNNSNNMKAIVYDLLGKEVMNQAIENSLTGVLSLNVSSLPSGTYFVTLASPSHMLGKKMVVKE